MSGQDITPYGGGVESTRPAQPSPAPGANLPATRPGDDSLVARAGASLRATTMGQEYIEYVEIKPDLLDVALANEIDLATCQRLKIIPVAADSFEVTIALADASNLVLLDDLRARFSPREVAFVAADLDSIEQVLARWSVQAAHEAERAAVRDLAGDSHTEADVREANDDNGRMAQLVSRLLEQAVTSGASDVHFEPGENALLVRFRLDGVLVPHNHYDLGLASGIVNRLKVMSKVEIAERRVPQDGRFHRQLAGREVDCRVVTLPTASGVEGAVVRLLDQSRSQLSLADIGFSPNIYEPLLEVLGLPHGMILVTGPTGSGKTTTLYAALGGVASSDRKVLTIEDPVEIRFPGVTQLQVNNKAGLTFPVALKSFLRADPDVILVGETRDRETAELAAQAALTGHLVLSTLHTNEASGAPTRLANLGLEGFVVASSLKAVLSQRLLRRLCAKCAEPYLPTDDELASVKWQDSGIPVPNSFWRPSGKPCDACNSRGYRGRLAAAEFVLINEALAEAIVQVQPSGELERIARANGSVSLHVDALKWVAAGQTSLDEVRRVGA